MEGEAKREKMAFEECRQIREFELEPMRLANIIDKSQAKKEKVVEKKWVRQLIPLLSMDILELEMKEPPEKGDDYPYLRDLLLHRF
ncbi:hypothetical protein NPIL_562671 [Nephila pilipes]|uniref:Uncharacterized protein n=1 Tax=Nephila pilipes TaxID=299642 RepID=A0A8X6NSA7_NEPPI|nr:hypothetical protein NPIL_562671 [Nephila pilipes]